MVTGRGPVPRPPRGRWGPSKLAEVARRFDLSRTAAPFTRCLRCNSPLYPVAREVVARGLPPRVRARHDGFRRCRGRGRIFWAGTHHARMAALLRSTCVA